MKRLRKWMAGWRRDLSEAEVDMECRKLWDEYGERIVTRAMWNGACKNPEKLKEICKAYQELNKTNHTNNNN